MGDIKPLLADMTAAKIQHFAAEARVLDASEIKEFNLPKRITLILCLIYSASVMTRDNLVEMFLKKMQLIHNHAKKELELIKQRYQETVEKLLGVFTNVLQVLVDESPEVGAVVKVDKVDKVERVNQILIPSGGAEQLLTECEAINAYKGNNYFPLLWQFYKSHRSTFFRLLGALKFSSTTNEQSVVEALNFILENQSRRGQFFNNTIDLDFASPQWQKLLFVEQGNKTKIVRRHLEVCVFSYRRKAEGRRQRAEGRKYNFCPLPAWFKAPKFIYEKKKKHVFRDAQRKKYYVPIESPKFMGFPFCLLPPAFCLLKSA